MIKSERCQDCGDKLTTMQVPEERLMISLLGFEFIVRRWCDKLYCLECESDRRNTKQERWLNDAADAGYQKGYEDGERARI